MASEVPTPRDVARIHLRSDKDSSKAAQHHTLGNSANQAAAGNHTHDDSNGLKMGPMEMDPANPGKTRPQLTCAAATAADIRTFLHNFFNFRDV